MWIIQEVVLSSDIIVMIGEYKSSWEVVTKTMHAYSEFGLGLFSVTISENKTIRQNFIESTLSILSLSPLRDDSQY